MSAVARSADIREVSLSEEAVLNEIAQMHMELLGFGPMAALGQRFVRDACYRSLMKTEMFNLAIYYVDQRPAGFVAYTHKSRDFHRVGLRQEFFRTAFEAIRSIISKPTRLIRLIAAIKVVHSRRSEKPVLSNSDGEVVCVAVRREYLTRKFVKDSQKRISEELVCYAAAKLRDKDIQKMRMIVDDDNKPVLFLYHRLGASFNPYVLGDRPSVEVWFQVDDLLEKSG